MIRPFALLPTKRSIAVPFLDDIVSQNRDRKKELSHVEIFRLLPSVIFAKDYSTEEPCETLLTKFRNEMFDEGLHFSLELKRWYKMWEQEIAKRNKNWQNTAAARTKNEVQSVIKKDNRKRNVEPAKLVDGKQQYQIDPPDGHLETISLAGYDLFPNIKKVISFWLNFIYRVH